jgi:hypothetical protein
MPGLGPNLDQAFQMYGEIVRRYGAHSDPGGRATIAATLNWRAEWQEAAGRGNEAAADRRALLERFADGESAQIDGQLDAALGLAGT